MLYVHTRVYVNRLTMAGKIMGDNPSRRLFLASEFIYPFFCQIGSEEYFSFACPAPQRKALPFLALLKPPLGYTGWPRKKHGTAYFPQDVDAITGISVLVTSPEKYDTKITDLVQKFVF